MVELNTMEKIPMGARKDVTNGKKWGIQGVDNGRRPSSPPCDKST
jgi:hypothetical protein